MASSKRFVQELRQELPELVKSGILSDEAAQRLLAHYAPTAEGRSGIAAHLELMFRVLCGLLVGGGIILVISHNWDMLPPAARLACGYLPLLAALALGAWVIVGRKGAAWCEPAALLIGAATASAIAVVSQCYHISGTLEDFLFAWLLLLIPFIYLFRSTALALVYVAGTLSLYADMRWHSSLYGNMLMPYYLLFMLLIAPMLWDMAKPGMHGFRRFSGRLAIVLLAANIEMVGSVGVSDFLVMFGCTVLPAALAVAGLELARVENSSHGNVFLNIGAPWLLGMVFAWSFDFNVGYRWEWGEYWSDWIVVGINIALWIASAGFVALRRLKGAYLFPVLVPLLLLGGALFSDSSAAGWFMAIACNMGLVIFTLYLMRCGFVERNAGKINLGMAILAALIFLRFVHAGDIFLTALCFIVLGILVGGMSFVVARRFRTTEKEK